MLSMSMIRKTLLTKFYIQQNIPAVILAISEAIYSSFTLQHTTFLKCSWSIIPRISGCWLFKVSFATYTGDLATVSLIGTYKLIKGDLFCRIYELS